MPLDIGLVPNVIASVIALFALFETKRANRVTREAIRKKTIEELKSLPDADVIRALKVGDIVRVQLVVFNNRTEPLRVHCVKAYRYERKARTLGNWIRSKTAEGFEWNFSLIEDVRWNPKGNLDDREHSKEEAIAFSRVKDQETLLVTVPDFKEHGRYRFDVITSQGTSSSDGHVSFGNPTFPMNFEKRIIGV